MLLILTVQSLLASLPCDGLISESYKVRNIGEDICMCIVWTMELTNFIAILKLSLPKILGKARLRMHDYCLGMLATSPDLP